MYDLKFNLLQLELLNVLNKLNIEPSCNRLNARKQALVYRLWAERFLTANQNITDWHKIDKNMKEFNNEYPELVLESEIIEHPYKGLVDKNGSLTRYPVIIDGSTPLKWSRAEVEAYLSEGGSFDSFGCYGADPYSRKLLIMGFKQAGNSGIPANLLGRFSTQTRLDFLPPYRNEFPLEESITAADYLRLSNGAKLKKYLEVFGIKTNKSLFHLNKKGIKWVEKEVATKATYRAIIRILCEKDFDRWVDIRNNPYKEEGNAPFKYALRCITNGDKGYPKYQYPKTQKAESQKLRAYLSAKGIKHYEIVGVYYYL